MSDIIPAPFDRRENLPGLLARAGQRLLDARDAAEVLEAKKLGEFALHLAKVTKAAKETHADCLRIITRAEMRMADEIDRGQASGEVASQGRPTENRQGSAVYSDLGIDHRRVAEWREVRDAGEGVVEAAIRRALDGGDAPTKALIVKAAKEISAERADMKRAARAEREAKLAAKIIALPDKHYGVIVADPEWKDTVWSEETGRDRHASNHYPTSDAAVIASRPVASIAARDCVLFMWTTNQHLQIALGVMEAWGFEYKSNYCWGKDRISTGRWNRSKHELLLIGTRGNVPCPAPGTQWESLIMAPKGKHSAKPECFLEMIEGYYPTMPKIELNRRGPPLPGWDAWGNEAPQGSKPETRIDPPGIITP